MVSIKNLISPIGAVTVQAQGDYIIRVSVHDKIKEEEIFPNTPILLQCAKEFEEYFEGKRKTFTFKYKNIGTPFREFVWKHLEKIPYGTTISYKDLANNINNQKAARAVGGANHNNNIWVAVPCHRVIGSNGSLVGYGGGLWRKKWLLEHEQKFK